MAKASNNHSTVVPVDVHPPSGNCIDDSLRRCRNCSWSCSVRRLVHQQQRDGKRHLPLLRLRKQFARQTDSHSKSVRGAQRNWTLEGEAETRERTTASYWSESESDEDSVIDPRLGVFQCCSSCDDDLAVSVTLAMFCLSVCLAGSRP